MGEFVLASGGMIRSEMGALPHEDTPSSKCEEYIPGPPPSYLEVMSAEDNGLPSYEDPDVCGYDKDEQQMTSETLGLPRLAYVDFLPYCFKPGVKDGPLPVFDSFAGLFKHVNAWLEKNRHYTVLQIESIERRVGLDGKVQSEDSVEHTAPFGTNGTLRGIRLWLIPTLHLDGPPQRFGYFNWLPEEAPTESEVWIRHGRTYVKHTVINPGFTTLDHSLARLNKCLAEKPVPGTVVSVQTMKILSQGDWHLKSQNPDKSCFFSHGNKSKLYINYLRIFYTEGPPMVQNIGLRDFVPEVTYKAASAAARPRFSEFGDIFQQASHWISQNDAKNVRITNIQTVAMRASLADLYLCNVGDVIVNTNASWYHDMADPTFIKTIRVAHVTLTEPEARPAVHLSTRLFLPVRTAVKSAEPIRRTVHRVASWLNVTGVPICSIASEKFPFSPEANIPTRICDTTYTIKSTRGQYMVTGVRLFLGAEYVEPDPSLLPPVKEFKRETPSSSCCIL